MSGEKYSVRGLHRSGTWVEIISGDFDRCNNLYGQCVVQMEAGFDGPVKILNTHEYMDSEEEAVCVRTLDLTKFDLFSLIKTG